MKYLAIDNNEFAIVGRKFALIFMTHLGDTFISYVMPNERGELEVYNFDSFLVEKFNAIDREDIKKSNTVEEKITNEFKIIAKGLINHWHKLLVDLITLLVFIKIVKVETYGPFVTVSLKQMKMEQSPIQLCYKVLQKIDIVLLIKLSSLKKAGNY